MAGYSNVEMADMHLLYGAANCNSREAVRLYENLYPNRQVPNKKTFQEMDRRLRETGKFKPKKIDSGRDRTVRTDQLVNRVPEKFDVNPRVSSRVIASQVGMSQSLILRVLHDDQLHPYHIIKVQKLEVEDYQPRVEFARWYLERANENPNFEKHILWTDEACFSQDGLYNLHNSHIWSAENPRVVRVRNQWRFSINIWAGIVDDYVIGPHVMPDRLDGQAYSM